MPSITTKPTDNQKGDQLIPGGGTIPLDQGSNNKNKLLSLIPMSALMGYISYTRCEEILLYKYHFR